jgi:hypothetical protein
MFIMIRQKLVRVVCVFQIYVSVIRFKKIVPFDFVLINARVVC